MVPDLDLQLGVVQAALRNVAGQGGAGGGLAAEQLQLSVATLDMVRALVPLQPVIARHELMAALDMARAAGLHDRVAAAEALIAKPGVSPAEMDTLRADILGAVAALVDADAPSPELRTAIVAGTRAALDIARACCLSAGFESDPGERERLAAVRARLFAEAGVQG